ncbi:hypothetical protein MFIFM68171_00803 [Madurella fahalii]|uniref:Uncharacterized protein n=1 Tax=Madurella fahalii TaxID=1157608 RepID=A0ABQ0FYN2_9PEZI
MPQPSAIENSTPNHLVKNTLQTDIEALSDSQTILPALSPCSYLTQIPLRPNSATTRAFFTLPEKADRNNVLLVIPTANESKSALLRGQLEDRKPDNVNLHYLVIKADSGVGEQPYDAAGARGAYNRVRNAVDQLALAEHQVFLRERRIGTVLVGAVENFIVRYRPPYLRQAAPAAYEADTLPVDYGLLVLCRVTAAAGPRAHAVLGEDAWEWSSAVSRGVTVPREYWLAAETHGFEDAGEGQTRTHGKVTVGEVLAANVPELDKANWHERLAGVSRYQLLRDAMEKVHIPWPGSV